MEELGKKIFSLVIFAFLSIDVLMLGFQAHALAPPWRLTITSRYGITSPISGIYLYPDWFWITCTVSLPATESGAQWICKGWIGTGSVPPSGNELSVHFMITQDSSITWIWESSTPNFGKTNVGMARSADGLTTYRNYTNLCQYFYGSRYQAPEDCFAQSISLYVEQMKMNGENIPLKVAIYNDNAGKPSTLVAQGASTIPPNYQNWMTVSLSTRPNLLSGNYYWLVANAVAHGEALRFYYSVIDIIYGFESVAETNQSIYGSTSSANFPTDPCVYSGFRTREYSIYCNYEPERYNKMIFGKSDVGSNFTNLCQYEYGSFYLIEGPAKSLWATGISLYVQEMNGENRPLKAAIYDGYQGVPRALLASAAGIVPAGFVGWFNVSIPPYFGVTSGRYYYLVADAIAPGKNLRFYYNTVNGPNQAGLYGNVSFAHFPANPCVYDGYKPRAYSIYCTYYDPFYFRQ